MACLFITRLWVFKNKRSLILVSNSSGYFPSSTPHPLTSPASMAHCSPHVLLTLLTRPQVQGQASFKAFKETLKSTFSLHRSRLCSLGKYRLCKPSSAPAMVLHGSCKAGCTGKGRQQGCSGLRLKDSFPHISYAGTVTTFSDSLSQAYLQIAQDFLQLSM